MTVIEGVYRNGRIELSQNPNDVPEGTAVVVTLPASREVDLAAHDIDQSQAAELRTRLAAFAADWETPEMDIYDDYDTAKYSSKAW